MNNYCKFALVGMLVSLCAACAGPMSRDKIDTIQTVGIVNSFPQSPTLVNIGTTIFNNQYDSLPGTDYYEKVTDAAIAYFNEKGFKAEFVKENSEQSRSKFDLLIELVPRDMYGLPDTYGYGVFQRSFLGMKKKPIVYVALNMGPYFKGSKQGDAFYKQGVTELEITDLPAQWAELTTDQQRMIDKALKQQIETTITELIAQLGI
ncbi:hypothetical protein [Amphritea sp.]|uniref:hypothetical protein n=1 Tax=Amphritea sp. TaxID=1872502 RepID=UPI003D0A9432